MSLPAVLSSAARRLPFSPRCRSADAEASGPGRPHGACSATWRCCRGCRAAGQVPHAARPLARHLLKVLIAPACAYLFLLRSLLSLAKNGFTPTSDAALRGGKRNLQGRGRGFRILFSTRQLSGACLCFCSPFTPSNSRLSQDQEPGRRRRSRSRLKYCLLSGASNRLVDTPAGALRAIMF